MTIPPHGARMGGSRQAIHDSLLNDRNTRMERMERIAFLGLGIMGSPMARRLLAAGYPLTVWNRTASRAEPLQAEGAHVAASPAEAVREAGVVITMLADPTAVREVIDGIARHLRPGTTLIEASTIGLQALQEVAALLPGGVALVDAPVMGSADRAASGQLVVLAGGDLTKVRAILEVFGTVTECGAVGHGAALKVVLINAVIAGVTVVGEAMALGTSVPSGRTAREMPAARAFRLACATDDRPGSARL